MSQISHAPVSFASKSHVAFFGSKKNVAANIFGKNCGVKNSSPDKLNMDSLGMLGNVLKQFPTESARFLQDSLVKFCAPAENPKLLEAIVPENFARIKMLNSLSASEKETLRRDLLYGDAPEFFITLSGLKPACIIGESKVDLGFLKKIKNDKLYGEKFVFVVSTGLVKIEENEVLVLVETAEKPEEIDRLRAERAAVEAKEALLLKKSLQERRSAEMKLARAMSRMRAKSSINNR